MGKEVIYLLLERSCQENTAIKTTSEGIPEDRKAGTKCVSLFSNFKTLILP